MNFYYLSGGALICDRPIPNITQLLDEDTARYFHGLRHFVAESMRLDAARRIAHALGGTLIDGMPPSRQLGGPTVDIRRTLSRHALYEQHV